LEKLAGRPGLNNGKFKEAAKLSKSLFFLSLERRRVSTLCLVSSPIAQKYGKTVTNSGGEYRDTQPFAVMAEWFGTTHAL
jgi:hypothetical protein